MTKTASLNFTPHLSLHGINHEAAGHALESIHLIGGGTSEIPTDGHQRRVFDHLSVLYLWGVFSLLVDMLACWHSRKRRYLLRQNHVVAEQVL